MTEREINSRKEKRRTLLLSLQRALPSTPCFSVPHNTSLKIPKVASILQEVASNEQPIATTTEMINLFILINRKQKTMWSGDGLQLAPQGFHSPAASSPQRQAQDSCLSLLDRQGIMTNWNKTNNCFLHTQRLRSDFLGAALAGFYRSTFKTQDSIKKLTNASWSCLCCHSYWGLWRECQRNKANFFFA